jgi:hypothetical protein
MKGLVCALSEADFDLADTLKTPAVAGYSATLLLTLGHPLTTLPACNWPSFHVPLNYTAKKATSVTEMF